MATLQTEDSLPGGLRFLTLRHAYQVAEARRAKAPPVLLAKTKVTIRNAPAASIQEAQDLAGQEGDTATGAAAEEESGFKPLEDGHQKLYSYFPPRMDGGKQEITVTQSISTKDEPDGRKGEIMKPPKTTTKPVTVEAPQFSLPEGCVHSVNPPPGGFAPAETLPHVVFTDPHLLWERRIEKQDDAARRERMPWLALLVFAQEELLIPDEKLQGASSLFEDTSLAKDAQGGAAEISQSSVFTLPLQNSDLQTLRAQGSVASPIPKPDSDDPTARTAAIFLKPDLFTKLVTTYERQTKTTGDGGGQTVTVVRPREGQTAADISRFRHFAHVRHVKTNGMAASALYAEGLFSVILSHRAGPLSHDRGTPAVVHLVSLEGWQSMALPIAPAVEFVALSSLYSWTYTAAPASTATSLKEAFRKWEDNIDVLRAPASAIDTMKKAADAKLSAKLAKRLSDGFTMQRHRTRTGEVTASFFRGALVPIVPAPNTWSSMSHCGSDLQILDPDTGMMDITYSAAWHLGKAMGMADAAFVTALSRLWNGLYSSSLAGAKEEKLSEAGAYKSRGDVLKSLRNTAAMLSQLQGLAQTGDETSPGVATAARELATPSVELAVDDAEIRAKSEEHAKRSIRQLAGAKDEEGQALYNELNTCVSPEWKVVLRWIRDRMFLFGIPAPYLIADSSFLPSESMRFFHIDPNWIDALIDGALSLGCHIERNDDYIRRCIKGAINAYLNTPDPATSFRPQIPTYGVLLRSDLVTRFPDLTVEAPIPPDAPEPGRAPILRQEIIDDGVLLCLFDRAPRKDEGMPVLSFTQPPHQQTFSLGDSLTPDDLHIEYKRTYTVEKQEYEFSGHIQARHVEKKNEAVGSPVEAGPPIFLWGEHGEARLLLADIWGDDVVQVLRSKMAGDFTDERMTSAVAAFQLGTPIYRFVLGPTPSLDSLIPDANVPSRPRGLQLLDPMRAGGADNSAVGPQELTLSTAAAPARPSFLLPVGPLQASPPHLGLSLSSRIQTRASPPAADPTGNLNVIKLPTNNLGQWDWLQPFNGGGKAFPDSVDVKGFGVSPVDERPRFEQGPYTAIEGYLSLKAPAKEEEKK